eukprot:GFKZ01000762.1.p1 GENE.GFKZ01000762.1~~GFKZ01000762.1.p1  ORF type:complete len:482 (-),score=68.64 GFKZ01000762.1:636-2000(-)
MRRSNPSIQPSLAPRRHSPVPPSTFSRATAAFPSKQTETPCFPFGKRFTLLIFFLAIFLYERLTPLPDAKISFAATAAPLAQDPDPDTVTTTVTSSSDPSITHILSNRSDTEPPQSKLPEPSDASPPANIAYFIQIADNTLHHLPRLLKSLYHPDNVYAIHFDLKIPPPDVAALRTEIFTANPQYKANIHIMQSELITYRGVSMLLNTINAMRLLLDLPQRWHYFINLSGADYPLINPATQRKLLGLNTALNFFTFAPRRTWDEMAEHRLSEVWYDESLTFRPNASVGKLTRLVVRNPLVDDRQFDVSHAEAWMIASRDFCDFVVRGDMARKMLVAFAYAVDSSEHYFASLAWNHDEYKESLVPHSFREIIWMHEGVLSGQHPYYVDEEGENGGYKFEETLQASVLFFARKFKQADSKLMDLIDERASDSQVIEKVTTHFKNKLRSRAMRVAEL